MDIASKHPFDADFHLIKSLPKLLLLRSATSPAFFLEVWLLTLELHVVVVLEELAPIACILLRTGFSSATRFATASTSALSTRITRVSSIIRRTSAAATSSF